MNRLKSCRRAQLAVVISAAVVGIPRIASAHDTVVYSTVSGFWSYANAANPANLNDQGTEKLAMAAYKAKGGKVPVSVYDSDETAYVAIVRGYNEKTKMYVFGIHSGATSADAKKAAIADARGDASSPDHDLTFQLVDSYHTYGSKPAQSTSLP